MRRGFTLVELLVVVAIIAALAVATVLALNPSQLLRQARDARRMSDLASLGRALGVYQASAATTSLGTVGTVYVSIPDASPSCAGTGLGGGYACAATSTYTSVGGTGWIPVNLSAAGSPALSALPVDPVNATSSGLYYTFQAGTGGTWKLSVALESAKYAGRAATDGGTSLTRVETGSDVSLPLGSAVPGSPVLWLDASQVTGLGDGATMASWPDRSGLGSNGTASGAPTYQATAANGKPAVRFAGTSFFTFPNVLAGTTAAEIFYVIKIPSDGMYNGFSAFSTASENSHYGYFGSVYDGFGSNARKSAGNPAQALDAWHVYNVSASSTWTARINGTQLFSAANAYAYRSAPTIGISQPAGVPFAGDIAEVVLYPAALDDATRAAVLAYLRGKYGL